MKRAKPIAKALRKVESAAVLKLDTLKVRNPILEDITFSVFYAPDFLVQMVRVIGHRQSCVLRKLSRSDLFSPIPQFADALTNVAALECPEPDQTLLLAEICAMQMSAAESAQLSSSRKDTHT